MKTKGWRKGHLRGVKEVVTRGYTHVGWLHQGIRNEYKFKQTHSHSGR